VLVGVPAQLRSPVPEVEELIGGFTFYTLAGAPVSRNFCDDEVRTDQSLRRPPESGATGGRQPVTAHLGVSSLIAWRAQNALGSDAAVRQFGHATRGATGSSA
jgi:hypothetical protein